MNAIRPLATITLLAVAGVFLYFKISEKEQMLPSAVSDWTLDEQVEIGSPVEAGPIRDSFAGEASPYTSIPQGTPVDLQSGSAQLPNNQTMIGNTQSQSAQPPRFQPSAVGSGSSSWAGAPKGHELEDASTQPLGRAAQAPPLVTPQSGSPESLPPRTIDVAAHEAVQQNLNGGNLNGGQAFSTGASQAPSARESQPSLFATTRQAVHESLDRGELSQALQLLSDWYGDPSLTGEEKDELQTLLGQLAGSVIYSKEHRLESPYLVQANETLEEIAAKYNTSWQLLAKINGFDSPDQLRAGQKIKVVRGPFSALIDLGDRQLTLMLDRRYAGKFSIDIDSQTTLEEGQWQVDQKLVTPGNVGVNRASALEPNEEESLVLTNPAHPQGRVAVLCGQGASMATSGSVDRAIQIQSSGIHDVFDILSVGSRVVIRR